MNLYTITENNGLSSRTICPKTCLSRAVTDANSASKNHQHNKVYIDQNGNNIELSNDFLERHFSSSDQLVFCDPESKEHLITIDVARPEFVCEWQGIFSLLTKSEENTDSPFQINGQDCVNFNVSRGWEFVVKTDTGTALVVLSHQDLLDAYEHKGDWHVRWESPVTGKHINFVFTFNQESQRGDLSFMKGTNEIEFARFISEINANIEFSDEEWSNLCFSMDLDKESIHDIFDLAGEVFEDAKDMLPI